MKYIIEVFSVLLLLVLQLTVCVAVVSVGAQVAAAKEYKAQVVAELENSNFNPVVIAGCKEQAETLGYELEIVPCVYDDTYARQIAEVRLTYHYQIPLLGVSQERVARGIAR